VIVVSEETTPAEQPDTLGLTDAPAVEPMPAAPAAPVAEQTASPTPQERLAETLSDDVEVGSDGTGMGELP
jgi:hypothetical protein